MKTLSKTATVYDNQGFVSARGATVIDHGDTIQINATEHAKGDLEIKPDRIESRMFGWSVVL